MKFFVHDFVGTLLNNCIIPEEEKKEKSKEPPTINITINVVEDENGNMKIKRKEPFSFD